MDCDRNEGRLAESVLRLSGQGVDDWPDGEKLTTPCSETCCNLLRRGGTTQIQGAITDMVASLVHGKSLECARLRGYFAVAVDGVEQEVTRLTKLSEGCRKMSQFEWVELLCRAIHEIGITMDFAALPRRYVRRMDL